MNNFLSERAHEIFDLHAEHLDEIVVILPNKRAAVYIQRYLAGLSQKPLFAPEMITINEWVGLHTAEKILNQHELLFILFDIHRQINNQEEDFNDFLKWGKTLLADFDEIDRYLVSPERIFADLRNIKEIEHWSFNEPELSKGQEKYLHFWNQLHTYYIALNKILDERGETYQGKAYQRMAETIATKELPGKHYYFLGFNALSASEEKIIHWLVKEKRATFKTDVDQFYFLNSEHEAAHFYRKLCEKWQLKPATTNAFNEHPKHFEIIESAQQTGQANIAGKLLQSLTASGADLDKTAIVLADESLLIPLCRALPQSLHTANITMGYPLKYSHLKSLVDLIFDLQFNFQKFKNSKLYHKSLLRVLDHTYIAAIIQNADRLHELEVHILEHNQVFIDWEEITHYLPELSPLGDVFRFWERPAETGFTAMNKLVTELYHVFKKSENKELELELLYHFSVSFKKFESIWNRYQHFMDLKSFKRMFYQFWQSEALSFLGNPTEGIQVMGILETRLLDFENLIILGMNEGNLPQSNVSNSYIPYDLKKHHQLPVEEDRQAIFAHHFYRLLHRAKRIYMTYNSGAEDGGNSEKSRYITQLENELDTTTFGHTITRSTYTPDDRSSVISTTRYPSVEAVHKKLDEYFSTQGLSPSALNKLVNCPLDFYYRYILEMKENEQVEENIESSTFGTKIHDVLEAIFRKNFLEKNEPLNSAVLKKEKPNLEKYLKDKYLESFSESEIKYGQNRLSFEVSLSFLSKFLDKQIEEIDKSPEPIFILELEKSLLQDLELNINGTSKKIRMSGLADRVDKIGNTTRIVDYKSGKCDDEKVVITESYVVKKEWHKLMDHSKKGYARQLLMYACMYRNNNPQQSCSAGIVSMININDWLQNVRVGKDGDAILSNEVLDAFEAELHTKIKMLYDPGFFFEHNPDSLYCEHCNV